jgi:hypothetical protein
MNSSARAIVDNVYSVLTTRTVASLGASKQSREASAQSLPPASVNRIIGLIAILAAPPYGGQAELDTLASSLALKTNELFIIAEGLHILEFAELNDGALKLTAAGRVFARGDTDERKRLFKEHLLRFVPLAAHICRVLKERQGHRAPRVRFETELEDHLNRHDAERTLRTATAWGRYAELFGYDDKTRSFTAMTETEQPAQKLKAAIATELRQSGQLQPRNYLPGSLSPFALNFSPKSVRPPMPVGFTWHCVQGSPVCWPNVGVAFACHTPNVRVPTVIAETIPIVGKSVFIIDLRCIPKVTLQPARKFRQTTRIKLVDGI